MAIEHVLVACAWAGIVLSVILGSRSMDFREGPAKAVRRRLLGFSSAFLFLLSYSGLALWLHLSVPGWPEAYGVTCRGRGCMIDWLAASPGLLSGGWRELNLFAVLWLMPVFLASGLVYCFVAKKGVFEKVSAE